MASLPRQPAAATPPTHIAIIMDGNGRWASARGLPRIAGHRQGAESVRRAVEGCIELGVRYLTLFGFSSENWKRPEAEVTDLMGLLKRYLQSEIAELHKNGVRLRVIGDRGRLAPDLVSLIENAERMTEANGKLQLVLALNYGSRMEIAAAARNLAAAVQAGLVRAEAIDERLFAGFLATSDIPDPDLVLRTSGEQRLSNFLLWQSAYAELVFLDVLWPDFNKSHLEHAIHEFNRRERRYGASSG
ncbi:MAG: isoprenyl transferase [Alphaproteobacteria bacterium]